MKKEIYETFFVNPFKEEDDFGKQYLHQIGRAMFGCARMGDKSFLLNAGKTNSGKGALTSALIYSFGSYVAEVNAEIFAMSKETDIAKALGSLVDYR